MLAEDRGLGGAALALLFTAAAAVPVQAQVGPVDRSGGHGPNAFDKDLVAHVLDRITYGRNETMMALIQAAGVDEFIRLQLNPALVSESAVHDAKLLTLPPPEDGNGDPQWDLDELYADYLFRAAFSNRQLREVLTEFWQNHFDTDVPEGNRATPERYRNVRWTRVEKEGFRIHALGRFRDLLEVSAKSPAMMYFLDNRLNRAGRGNENYARELLELHSLGVDNGYTQQDVQEVARAFTGWTLTELSTRCDVLATDGLFCYNDAAHDATPKTILGVAFPAGRGIEEGEQVLDMLAVHPNTASFVCGKLIQKFVADEPPARLQNACVGTFLHTAGDIKAVMSTILFSPEFRAVEHRGNKVRTPLEYVLASLRNLEGDTDGVSLWGVISSEGQDLFQYPIPTGYAEVGPAWISTSSWLQRWRWADAFTHNARPSYLCDPWAIANRLGIRTREGVVQYFLEVLVRGRAGPLERALLDDALMNGQTVFDFNSSATQNGVRNVVSLILGLPEYEKQ